MAVTAFLLTFLITQRDAVDRHRPGQASGLVQRDWSAGDRRRSLAEVLVDAAPGRDLAAPGQHEVGPASGPDSPHLRSGMSAGARVATSVSMSARSSSFARHPMITVPSR